MPERAASSFAFAHAASESLTGRLLGGRYRVGERIASTGVVPMFRAVHVELGRPCALKVIRPTDSGLGLAWRAAQARFRVEALAGARLDHPNVLRVLDLGREHEDGLHYLVTEPLDGVDLASVLAAEGPLGAERVARIGRGLCAALQHAHERGVVHRDLRPENVRLVRHAGDEGRVAEEVKLLDFGAALIAGEDPGDRDDRPAGASPYQSPEQAAGAAVDARSDLYALGVVLFELATGRRPTGRAGPSALGIPMGPRLEAIILGCLAARPADRPSAARDVRDALDLVLARPAVVDHEDRPRSWAPLLVAARRSATVAGIAAAIALWGRLYAQEASNGGGAKPLRTGMAPRETTLADAQPAAARAPGRQVLRDAGTDGAVGGGGAARASQPDAAVEAEAGASPRVGLNDAGAAPSPMEAEPPPLLFDLDAIDDGAP
jgi:serine/threonine-protein kinase